MDYDESQPETAEHSLGDFLHRMINFPQMDFDYSMWQMINLCVAPNRVARVSSLRKQSRERMARDDPAFVVIQVGFLLASSVAYTAAYHSLNPAKMAQIITYSILVDWLLVGAIVSTVCWLLANNYLTGSTRPGMPARLEWLFAFDVHCNAFVPLFLLLYVVQYFLAPILLQPYFLSRLLANSLYFVAFSSYYYVTFISYTDLRFLAHTEVFLYPIGIAMLGCLLAVMMGVNLTQVFLNYYFHT